jgi:hypothetical protein
MQCQTPGTNCLARVPEPDLGYGQREISRQRSMGHSNGAEGKPPGMVLRSQPLSLQPGHGDGGQGSNNLRDFFQLEATDSFNNMAGKQLVYLLTER